MLDSHFDFDVSELTGKIHLPNLKTLHVKKNSYLRCFSKLN
jgi:hypothetical protein